MRLWRRSLNPAPEIRPPPKFAVANDRVNSLPRMNKNWRSGRVVNSFEGCFYFNTIDWALAFLAIWIAISPWRDKSVRQMSMFSHFFTFREFVRAPRLVAKSSPQVRTCEAWFYMDLRSRPCAKRQFFPWLICLASAAWRGAAAPFDTIGNERAVAAPTRMTISPD